MSCRSTVDHDERQLFILPSAYYRPGADIQGTGLLSAKPPSNVMLDAGHRRSAQMRSRPAHSAVPWTCSSLPSRRQICTSQPQALLVAGLQCSTSCSGFTLLEGNCFANCLQLDLAIRRQCIPPIRLRHQLNQLLKVLASMASGQVPFKRSQ